MPIKVKFHVEPLWGGGKKVHINDPGHMTKMALTRISSKISRILLLSVNITDHSKSKKVNSACIGLGVVLVMNQSVFLHHILLYINSLLELRKEMKFVCLFV